MKWKIIVAVGAGALVVFAFFGFRLHTRNGVVAIPAKMDSPVDTAAVLPVKNSSSDSIRISFVGDLMFDRNVKARMQTYGQEYPLANVVANRGKPFGDIDLLIGNLEGAVSKRRPPVKSIDFAFDSTIPALLKEHGFAAVSDANNHGLDQGQAGLVDTKQALESVGLGHFGEPVNDDTAPWVTTVKGKQIAFFGYNSTDNLLDRGVAEKNIRAAAKKYDAVIIFMHWGVEYAPIPPQTIKDLGRTFIDWGATAVIGAHPHVMEGMEVYKGKPILWSLGNFVFDQDWSEETQHGLAVTLTLADENHFTLELFPIDIIKSQPQLSTEGERDKRLQNFATRSTLAPELLKTVSTGKLSW